jgi:predicted GNAT family acetyltransferase
MDNVIDNASRRRFELTVGGEVATADYELDGNTVVLVHTEVPSALAGQGVGSRLAKGVFDTIRASGRRVATVCPFMASYAKKHPEYAPIIDS